MVDRSATMSPEDRALLSRVFRKAGREWGRTAEPQRFFHTGIWRAGDIGPAGVVYPLAPPLGGWVGGTVNVHFSPYQVCTSQNNIIAPSHPSFGHSITGYGDGKSRINSWTAGVDFIPKSTFVNGGELFIYFDGYYEAIAGTANMKATFIVEPNATPTGSNNVACGAASAKAAIFTSAAFGGVNENKVPFWCVLHGKALGIATHHWTASMYCGAATTALKQNETDFGTLRMTGASGYDWQANDVQLSARFKVDTVGDGATAYAQDGKNVIQIERYGWHQIEEPI